MPETLPETGLRAYVIELAAKHNVTYVETAGDRLANTFTRLSGDKVAQDDIADLLLALMRAQVIDGAARLQLHHRYLKERAGRR